MNHDERLKRADEAQRLLNEPALKNAFADIREGFVKSIEGCKWNDDKTLNNLMLSMQLLKTLNKLLESHIIDGKIAQKEIGNMNKPKSRFSVAR